LTTADARKTASHDNRVAHLLFTHVTAPAHQAAAHIIVPDDNQQAVMQDPELLANYPPDNEQRFHQHGQIGKVLDKLPNTHLVLDRADRADLETEVAQGGTQVVLDGMTFD